MIYACGCSFTYGLELQNPAQDSWPALLSKRLNQLLINDATPGGSNYRTVYHTIKNLNKFDYYLIAWTEYSRFTFYKSDNNLEIDFNPHLSNKLYRNESFYSQWGTALYKHWYNELYAFKLWLQQIIQLQSLLKSNYLMINTFDNNLSKWLAPEDEFIQQTKDLLNFDNMNDDQIFAEYQEIQYYIKLIDTSKFYK